MSFASRISRVPLPFDREFGAEAARDFADAPDGFRDLITGAAGCSPYLRTLLMRHGTWLRERFGESPEAMLEALFAEVPGADHGSVTPDALSRPLRVLKGRAALLIALADLGGVWRLGEVTGALTRLADLAVGRALGALVAQDIARGRIPGAGDDDRADAAGMIVLAMGKMGAFELNYSSDIDLIVLFDETRHDPAVFDEVRARFIRATRGMCALLSDITEAGYVFRTDLRLRPDPSVTPVCISTEAAERYYESFGRTWERAAFIKARCCAGSLAAGARFLSSLTPFVWRRHLDYAAIRDAQDMRLRIRDHKGLHGPLVLEGHDMKLGRGGIREIEFFTQTRQIIAGGRDPELRTRETLDGLSRLAARGWVPEPVRAALEAAYLAHRETEHRLQMLNDAQTHALPATAEGFARLAAFSGQGDVGRFRAELTARIEEVHELTEPFFMPEARGRNMPAQPVLSEAQQELVEGWYTRPVLRAPRAREVFRRILPQVLSGLERATDTGAALKSFDGFLSGLPAGVQLFSLFEANPQLIDLMADICATAPGLARYLSRNAAVFDAVIGGDFFAPLPDADTLTADLAGQIEAEPDYERRLDTARRWMKERHFRIGVLHLRGLADADEASRAYADLAEAVVRAIWPSVRAQFARRHGTMAGQGAAVVAMGSLGTRSLTATSDLDLIVIYDSPAEAMSDGARSLAAPAYYARLTQALVSALAAPTSEGRLYETDMRLRPSGRQGPVATAFPAFRNYQMNEAWTWEHMALTRARVIAAPTSLGRDIEEFRAEVLHAKGGPGALERVRAQIADMRRRLDEVADPLRRASPWEAKIGAGRLLEQDIAIQGGALIARSTARDVAAQLEAGRAVGWFDDTNAASIADAHRVMRRVQQVARLVTEESFRPEDTGRGAQEFLLRETGARDLPELAQLLECRRAAAAGVLDKLVAGDGEAAA